MAKKRELAGRTRPPASRQVKIPKDLRKAAEAARRDGWTIQLHRRNTHMKWVSPQGDIVVMGGNASCPRAIANNIALLRRAGLNV